MTRKVKITIAGVMVCVSIAVILLLLHTDSNSNTKTYRVKKEHREYIVEISGNIEAANEQSFNAPADTRIERIYVKEGDRVKKGQLMIQLDALEQEYAILNQEYQIDQKRLTGAGKDIQVMEKQLEVLKKKREDRQCIARFDGVLAQLSVEEGEFVEIKDALGVLIDRSYLIATVEVAETDAGKLKLNQPVTFSFPAYQNTVIGYVSYIPSVGTVTTRGATVVNAEVRIDNPPDEILTGFSFTGTIQVQEPQDILIIEKKALVNHNGKITAHVVSRGGESEVRTVIAEPYGDSYMLITDGLYEGDIVTVPELKGDKAKDGAEQSLGIPGMRKQRKGAGGPPPGAR